MSSEETKNSKNAPSVIKKKVWNNSAVECGKCENGYQLKCLKKT